MTREEAQKIADAAYSAIPEGFREGFINEINASKLGWEWFLTDAGYADWQIEVEEATK